MLILVGCFCYVARTPTEVAKAMTCYSTVTAVLRLQAMLVASLCGVPVAAEVATDGSLGAAVTLQGDMQITPDLGQQRGSNLFHSFSRFNVEADESATFTGDVSHIFSRVTGGSASQVDGALAVEGEARLWLINPNGIMFGDNSSVDANGGFTALAGDSLQFSDGSQFSAQLSQNSTLSSAAPSAYGLLNAAAPIVVNGDIVVGDGSELALAGSAVTLNSGLLSAADQRAAIHQRLAINQALSPSLHKLVCANAACKPEQARSNPAPKSPVELGRDLFETPAASAAVIQREIAGAQAAVYGEGKGLSLALDGLVEFHRQPVSLSVEELHRRYGVGNVQPLVSGKLHRYANWSAREQSGRIVEFQWALN